MIPIIYPDFCVFDLEKEALQLFFVAMLQKHRSWKQGFVGHFLLYHFNHSMLSCTDIAKCNEMYGLISGLSVFYCTVVRVQYPWDWGFFSRLSMLTSMRPFSWPLIFIAKRPKEAIFWPSPRPQQALLFSEVFPLLLLFIKGVPFFAQKLNLIGCTLFYSEGQKSGKNCERPEQNLSVCSLQFFTVFLNMFSLFFFLSVCNEQTQKEFSYPKKFPWPKFSFRMNEGFCKSQLIL